MLPLSREEDLVLIMIFCCSLSWHVAGVSSFPFLAVLQGGQLVTEAFLSPTMGK
jgi:hypothetical protein